MSYAAESELLPDFLEGPGRHVLGILEGLPEERAAPSGGQPHHRHVVGLPCLR